MNRERPFGNMLEKSAIVVAHPDDEILWFSAIAAKVDSIIICFSKQPSRPDWTIGRENALASFPIQNTINLSLTAAESFNQAEWASPVTTRWGLEISRSENAAARYKDNWSKLYNHLANRLQPYKNIFTHNPWGEYGHEEHVQVFRVIQSLQQGIGFTLWCSNYCSNKSATLMNRHICATIGISGHHETDKEIAKSVMRHYKRHNCWTWYNDWAWPATESFLQFQQDENGTVAEGRGIPLNFVTVPPQARSVKSANVPLGTRLKRKIRRLFHGPGRKPVAKNR